MSAPGCTSNLRPPQSERGSLTHQVERVGSRRHVEHSALIRLALQNRHSGGTGGGSHREGSIACSKQRWRVGRQSMRTEGHARLTNPDPASFCSPRPIVPRSRGALFSSKASKQASSLPPPAHRAVRVCCRSVALRILLSKQVSLKATHLPGVPRGSLILPLRGAGAAALFVAARLGIGGRGWGWGGILGRGGRGISWRGGGIDEAEDDVEAGVLRQQGACILGLAFGVRRHQSCSTGDSSNNPALNRSPLPSSPSPLRPSPLKVTGSTPTLVRMP